MFGGLIQTNRARPSAGTGTDSEGLEVPSGEGRGRGGEEARAADARGPCSLKDLFEYGRIVVGGQVVYRQSAGTVGDGGVITFQGASYDDPDVFARAAGSSKERLCNIRESLENERAFSIQEELSRGRKDGETRTSQAASLNLRARTSKPVSRLASSPAARHASPSIQSSAAASPLRPGVMPSRAPAAGGGSVKSSPMRPAPTAGSTGSNSANRRPSSNHGAFAGGSKAGAVANAKSVGTASGVAGTKTGSSSASTSSPAIRAISTPQRPGKSSTPGSSTSSGTHLRPSGGAFAGGNSGGTAKSQRAGAGSRGIGGGASSVTESKATTGVSSVVLGTGAVAAAGAATAAGGKDSCSVESAVERGEVRGDGDEFRTTGNDLIGARVRRMLLEFGTVVGHVDGTVTGWLPAEESDFVSEVTKEPAALWHVQFDTDEVGSEDLEEHEVVEAIRTYRTQTSKLLVGQRVWRLFPGIGELLGEVVRVVSKEGGEELFEVAFDDGLLDLLPWDDVHASVARGLNSHAHSNEAKEISRVLPRPPLTIGFKRISEVLPNGSLSGLVRPYNARYSHVNAEALAILSRFMPPASRSAVGDENSLIPSEISGLETFCSEDAGMEDISTDASFHFANEATDNMKTNCLSAISEECEFNSVTSADLVPAALDMKTSQPIAVDSVALGRDSSEDISADNNTVRPSEDSEGHDPKLPLLHSRDAPSLKVTSTQESQNLDPVDLIRASWWSCIRGNSITFGTAAGQEPSSGTECHGCARESCTVIESLKEVKDLSTEINNSGSAEPEEKQSELNPFVNTTHHSESSDMPCMPTRGLSTHSTDLPKAAISKPTEKDSIAQIDLILKTDKEGLDEELPKLDVALPNDVETSAASGPEFDEDESLPQKEINEESVENHDESICTKNISSDGDASTSDGARVVELAHSQKRDRTQWEAELAMCQPSDDIDFLPRTKRRRTSGMVENVDSECGDDHSRSIETGCDRIQTSRTEGDPNESVTFEVVQSVEKMSDSESGEQNVESGDESKKCVMMDVNISHSLDAKVRNSNETSIHPKDFLAGTPQTKLPIKHEAGMLTGANSDQCIGSEAKPTMEGPNILPKSDKNFAPEIARLENLPIQIPETAPATSGDKCVTASGKNINLPCGIGPGIDEADLAVDCASADRGVVAGDVCRGNDSEHEVPSTQCNSRSVEVESAQDSCLTEESEGAMQRECPISPAMKDVPIEAKDAAELNDGVQINTEMHSAVLEVSSTVSAPGKDECGCEPAPTPSVSAHDEEEVFELPRGKDVSHIDPTNGNEREKSEASEVSGCPNESSIVSDLNLELDDETAELLAGEESTFWINGSLIRQAIECEDDGTVFQARVNRIDERRSRVLVHFLGWSARHDRWVPLNSRRIRVLPGGTKRDRTDNTGTASAESSVFPQEERRTRTRTSVIMAQAAGRAAASGSAAENGASDDIYGPEAERRRFGGINSAGMHVPVATSEPMAGLVYTCDGLPATAVSAILAQLLASAANRTPLQSQGRAAGRGGARASVGGGSSSNNGEYEGPISRECCWAWPDLAHTGLLGGLLTPPNLHRNRQPAANRPVLAQASNRLQGSASVQPATATRTDAVSMTQTPQGRTAAFVKAENEISDVTEVPSQQTELDAGLTNRTTGKISKAEIRKSVGQDSSKLISCQAVPLGTDEGSQMSVDSPSATGTDATSSSKLRPGEKSSESRNGKPSRPVKLAAASLYAVGTAVEVRLDNGEWTRATITDIKSRVANSSSRLSRLECRIAFDEPDDFVDLFLPNPCVRLVFAVGTAVEVRLDNGEWAAATITAVRTPAANDSGGGRLVYRISFDEPDDFVDLSLPNESVRIARAKRSSGLPQRPARQSASSGRQAGTGSKDVAQPSQDQSCMPSDTLDADGESKVAMLDTSVLVPITTAVSAHSKVDSAEEENDKDGELEDLNTSSPMQNTQVKRRRQRRRVSYQATRRIIRTRAKATALVAPEAGVEPGATLIAKSTEMSQEMNVDSKTESEGGARVKSEEDSTSEHNHPLINVSSQIHMLQDGSACEIDCSSNSEVCHQDSAGSAISDVSKSASEVLSGNDLASGLDVPCCSPVGHEHSEFPVHVKLAPVVEGCSEPFHGETLCANAQSSSENFTGKCQTDHRSDLDVTPRTMLQHSHAEVVPPNHLQNSLHSSCADNAAAEKQIGPDLDQQISIEQRDETGSELEASSKPPEIELSVSDLSEFDDAVKSVDCNTELPISKNEGPVVETCALVPLCEDQISLAENTRLESEAGCGATSPKPPKELACEHSCGVGDTPQLGNSRANDSHVNQSVTVLVAVKTSDDSVNCHSLPVLQSSSNDTRLIKADEQARADEYSGAFQEGNQIVQDISAFEVSESSGPISACLSADIQTSNSEISDGGNVNVRTVGLAEAANEELESAVIHANEENTPCTDSGHRADPSNQESVYAAASELAATCSDLLPDTTSNAPRKDTSIHASNVTNDVNPISNECKPEGSAQISLQTQVRIDT